MARLIDADVAMDAFMDENTGHESEKMFSCHDIDRVLGELPAVDAVPVVRCKDCQYLYDKNGEYCCCCHSGMVLIYENSFCSHGVRRK